MTETARRPTFAAGAHQAAGKGGSMRMVWLTASATAAIWAIAAEPAAARTTFEDIANFSEWRTARIQIRDNRPAQATPLTPPSRRTAGDARRESGSPSEVEKERCANEEADCPRRRRDGGGAIPDSTRMRQRQLL